MTHSQRAKDLVHAILDHPRVQGNNWNAEIWAELYAVAEKALDDQWNSSQTWALVHGPFGMNDPYDSGGSTVSAGPRP